MQIDFIDLAKKKECEMAVMIIQDNVLLNEANSLFKASSKKLELTFDGLFYTLKHGEKELLNTRDSWIVDRVLMGVLIGLES